MSAFHREALPWIERHQLKKITSPGKWDVFADRQRHRWAVISGIGKSAAAAAVAHLWHVAGQPQHAIWWNFGVAGSADAELGTLRVAHKVIDDASGQVWFPQFPFHKKLPGTTVRTVDRPTDFSQKAQKNLAEFHDMEAAGFLEAAMRITSSEFAHVAKVVSDNAENSLPKICKADCDHWLAAAIKQWEEFEAGLQAALTDWANDTDSAEIDLTPWIKHWHFSAFQRAQLQSILHDLRVLGNAPTPDDAAQLCDSAREVLAFLQEKKNLVGFR